MSKPMPSPINNMCQPQDISFVGANDPAATTARDRRRTQRFPLKPKMFLVRVGGLPVAMTLKNISCGGACGLLSEALTEGARLVLELDPRTHVEAEVRWVARMTVGLKFLKPLDPNFVAAFRQRHAPQG